MTPVDATSTCCGAQPSAAAVAATVASVVARPSAPVHAFAQPLLTMTACAWPPDETRLARDTFTGAACTWFVVKSTGGRHRRVGDDERHVERAGRLDAGGDARRAEPGGGGNAALDGRNAVRGVGNLHAHAPRPAVA